MYFQKYFGTDKLKFEVLPDDVLNYQRKVLSLHNALGEHSSYKDCMYLVLISESVNAKIKKLTKKKKEKLNSYFITVNAKKDTCIKDLVKCIDKAKTKKWIDSAMYCYEQRSETIEEFKGFHCHMLIIANKKKYKTDIINEFYNTCKSITTKNAINCKYVKTQKDVDQIQLYMRGIKKDKLKQQKIVVDKFFRSKYELQEYYKY